MTQVSIHIHDGTQLNVPPMPELSLGQLIFLQGLWQDVPLCSGLGKCGLCRILFLSAPPEPRKEELKKLSDDEIAKGWRLACLHPATACTIGLPEPLRTQRSAHVQKARGGDYTLAVDLGTTSIHWSVLVGDEVVVSGNRLNPQVGLGSEIMTRLSFAATREGARILRKLVLDAIDMLIAGMDINIQGKCVGLAVSGNPAMTYLLLGLETDGLASAPYALSYAGGDLRTLADNMPQAYIPPLLAPFVGADLSAGLAALHFSETPPEHPYLLADLGTNGEFILALSEDEYLCASVPMGPALEGVGLSAGRTASPGAISGFAHSPAGIAPRRIPGESGPARQGMTGTAYLSLAALLRSEGVLDESGLYQSGSTPQAHKLARRISRQNGEPAFEVLPGLHMPASDVEEILKVKAAFNLALSRLLAEAGIAPSGLRTLYLAGALGEHVNLDDLEALGFLNTELKYKTVKAGNTSLRGTQALLTVPGARDWVAALPGRTRVLDLAGDGSFGAQYMERMRFTYVD
ncbi:ASKHA domain-containing protein [Salidesulfovibrio onnuriiensis]|uniref:ASKHA domain-containing protein n=1 Tax=Salidesulfovibrio onnuriiensis TaxID=2583823 RepID=UPI0011C793BE|nr:ASKHA domain-containing protein [Salidesulfovibrio onnuriiensis]